MNLNKKIIFSHKFILIVNSCLKQCFQLKQWIVKNKKTLPEYAFIQIKAKIFLLFGILSSIKSLFCTHVQKQSHNNVLNTNFALLKVQIKTWIGVEGIQELLVCKRGCVGWLEIFQEFQTEVGSLGIEGAHGIVLGVSWIRLVADEVAVHRRLLLVKALRYWEWLRLLHVYVCHRHLEIWSKEKII